MDGLSIHVSMQLATRRLALFAVLTSLCLALQLTPRPPNVEFTSLFVFFVGAAFGVILGGFLGAFVMLLNGFLSSWGFAGLMMPFQISGMVIVGVAGAVYGRSKEGKYTLSSSGEVAVLGAFLTLVYDVITNFGVAVSFMLVGTPLVPAMVSAMIPGVPFSIVHVASNALVFLVAFFPLNRAVREFLGGGETAWRNDILHT
jgi:hypothetical protein